MTDELPRWASEIVGKLPDGWTSTRIGAIGDLISGSTPPRSEEEKYFTGGQVPWVKTGDLNDSDILETDERVTEAAVKECRCAVHPVGTVLVAMYGGFEQIGRTGILRVPAATNQAITAIRIKPDAGVSPDFLQYWLNQKKSAWRRIAGSSRKDPNISKSDIAAFPVPIPTANTIGKMDRAVASLDRIHGLVSRMVDVKCTFKRGLMQQLLSGQKRFPEFLGTKWEEVHLGDIFLERTEANRPDLPLLSVTGDRGLIPRDEVDKRDSSNPDKSKYKRVAIGDIAYNTMRMWQGVSALASLEGIISPAYTVAIPTNRISGRYIRNVFKYPPVINLFHRHSQGLVDDTLNLKFDRFSKIKLTVPSEVAEQERIADVLDLLESEIELLSAFGKQFETYKRGLLSRLLSGSLVVSA